MPEHGEWSRYTHHRCRCVPCSDENRRRVALWRDTGSTVDSAPDPTSNTVPSENDPTPTTEGP